MLELKPKGTVGQVNIGWLKARHHFNVGPHCNPAHTAIGPLHVWNDDDIAPDKGFGLHGHSNTEIVTFVYEGVLVHGDGLGNRGALRAGEVQTISAGSGIRHEELTEKDGAKIFQMWLKPSKLGGKPAWGTKCFPSSGRTGKSVVLASNDPADGGLHVDSNVKLYSAVLTAGSTTECPLPDGAEGYLVSCRGKLVAGQVAVEGGDGLVIKHKQTLHLHAQTENEIVLVVTM